MRRWAVASLSGGVLLATSTPSLAGDAERQLHHDPAQVAPLATRAPPAAGPTSALPNYDAMMAIVEKIFPPQPDPDPARLARARACVEAMWPNGAYAKMMSGFIGNMMTGVLQMKKSDLSALAAHGTKPAKTGPTDSSIHDQAIAKDPYFDQRMAATRAVIDEELGRATLIIDPRMREGLARAMARRFDERQLGDINAFLATPSGHAFANEYFQLWFEPDTLRSMFGAFPELVKLMPDAMQKLKAVNERFPRPKPPASTPVKH